MGRGFALAVVSLLALLLVAVPISLHLTQIAHNELALEPPEPVFVPGSVFASTASALMRHELDSAAGWRPNDFVLWGPGLWADNNSNRQLGIIQALRESVRVLRDHLTKVSATEYDQNLVQADTFLRNDEYKFWFPSAEGRFTQGCDALDAYVSGLHGEAPTSKPINRRNVELIRLFQAWTDLLGGAHASLIDEAAGSLETDDRFYRAQGFAHVMLHLTRAVRAEYETELAPRGTVLELLDQVEGSLARAATLKPLIVLDGSPSGLFANHRRNLAASLVDARQLMYSIREELEK